MAVHIIMISPNGNWQGLAQGGHKISPILGGMQHHEVHYGRFSAWED